MANILSTKMRIFWICAAAFMFCVETDAAPPTDKRLWDVLSATRQRRTDGSGVSSCQKASEALGQILQLREITTYGSYLHYFDVFMNFNASDPEERETFVCQFSDLVTLRDLVNAADGILDHLIRRAYNYLTVTIMHRKQLLLALLDDPNGYSWISPQQVQGQLDFIRQLESTGFLSHDPEGANVFLEMINEDIGGSYIENYTAEPLSDEPVAAQGNKLTNAMRKVWNEHVKEMSEWNPDYSEELRQSIKEWSGITIGNHEYEEALVILILMEADHGGQPLLTRLVRMFGVINHAFKTGYPLLVDSIDSIQSDLENYNAMDEIQDSNYNDYDAIMNLIDKNELLLLESLREMGLFSLEDNL